MQHRVTQELQKLRLPLTSESGLSFYIAVSRRDAEDKSRRDAEDKSYHGFGIVIDAHTEEELNPISNGSDTAKSNHMRGALAGVLTTLEWVEVNCEPDIKCIVFTNESYVYQHLRPRIKVWLREPSRVNLDLLGKLDPLLDKHPNVEFQRSENAWHPQLMDQAKALAVAAAGHAE